MITPTLAQEVSQLEAELCFALADPTRILMLYALEDGPRNVTDLGNALGITQPTASRHLKVLRDRGLVRPERSGVVINYHLLDRRILQALDLLRSVLRDRLMMRANLMEEIQS
ncbi:MAG: ArsR family transcriptional regulator [Anaerolineaceae bacterium]|nr:MAG: ArsR family transcriptional regulator [Anaerolineaceae bacterium]